VTVVEVFAVACVVAMGLMAGVFVIGRRIANFSVVDVAWSLNFIPLAWLAAALGSGNAARRLAVAVLVSFWSARLGAHLWTRIAALHPAEEGRYVELRRRWAADLDRRFFAFFLFQGALNGVLCLPAILACFNASPTVHPLEIAGALLFVASLAGESSADASLAAFRRRADSKGRVCREGLWRYSRHPNYFFEWLVWCAFALIATPAPWGFLAWSCPALMLYFLLRVTGIPATEEQAVRSRGDAYREYQRTTSAFVPWFPRNA
jgi:steroid 5-alpha reductase family enzyme